METLLPTASEPVRLKVPSNQELFDFFNQLLKGWTGLSAQRVDGVDDEAHPLPLERGLMFTAPSTGILVIRTTPEIEARLRKVAGGDKGQPAQRDVFVELFILFWHRLVGTFWNLDSRKLPPGLFKKSIPLDWPTRKPDALLVVFIEDYPLAIRLWTPLTDEEMNRWRAPKK